MKIPANGVVPGGTIPRPCEGEKKSINAELWQACAGPLVNLPVAGTHVLYFPQGHSEQVAASMKRNVDAQMPNYSNLPSKLLCLLHSVTLHADPETDEVYAQMTLQPVSSVDKEALLRSDFSMRANKPQTDFFCKTLTASDTSTHGGFSVPRRAAEKIFPTLDFSMQPPAQELRARDLHDSEWTFRHIYRGQPKRHLLTTGWSLFISGKRLSAGDSVLFIRDERQKHLLGIRRANRQPTNLSSSVLSSDSMHIGILAAAAHAAANNSPFTVFYNPRASPSEFVIPLAKYYRAVHGTQISPGMRFRMMFETEESVTRRHMGTITGISDLDPIRWKNSQWRNLQVGWDESTTGEKYSRVSAWDIEPVTAPFFFCPPPFIRPKRFRQPGLPDDEPGDLENLFKRTMPWVGDDISMKDPQVVSGLSLAQWIGMQQNSSFSTMQPNYMNSIPGSALHNFTGAQILQQNNVHLNGLRAIQQVQPLDQMSNLPSSLNQLNPIIPPQQPVSQNLMNQTLPTSQNLMNQTLPTSQIQSQFMQTPSVLRQLPSPQNHQVHRNHQQQIMSHGQSPSLAPSHLPDQQLPMPDNQILPIQKVQQPHQLLETSQSFSRPLELPDSQTNLQFSQSTQPPPLLSPSKPQCGLLSELTGQAAFPPRITDDVPSRSTSLSGNNCSLDAVPSMVNGKTHQPSCPLLVHESIVEPSLNLPRRQSHDLFVPPIYSGVQMDYMETSSSATSASLSQNDGCLKQNDKQETPLFSADIDGQLGIPLICDAELVKGTVAPSNDLLSSSMVSPSFEAFNSIDSSGLWGPPPLLPRMRTFTKVYKQGAVGRSIDMSHYSGYEELKQDVARRFGIEGQLEEEQKVGWKLVYHDHENDLLLVGDDPWEEFVNCVRCIKILSPKEVQQMSVEGDFGNSVLSNQACSSSDGGGPA